MAIPAPRVILWTAALLAVGAAIALVRLQPNDTPSVSLAIDPPDVGDDAADRVERDARGEYPPAAAKPSDADLERTSDVVPIGIPQNAEDLRAGSPVFAPIIDANERALGSEDEDPAWATVMETRIVNEISQKALGIELANLAVDCRTTLCRVDMTFPLQLLQRQFEPSSPDTRWNGKQPVGFFLKALELDFRQPVPSGLNRYGTPVVVGYVNRAREETGQ